MYFKVSADAFFEFTSFTSGCSWGPLVGPTGTTGLTYSVGMGEAMFGLMDEKTGIGVGIVGVFGIVGTVGRVGIVGTGVT